MLLTDIEFIFKEQALKQKTTIAKVSKKAGIPNQSVYSAIFKGNPTIKSLVKLADSLDCDVKVELVRRVQL